MALLLAALLLGQQGLAAGYPDDAEIVVMARRMAQVEAVLGRDERGKVVCSISRSSGLPQIDALICKDSAACLKSRTATQEQIEACIAARKPALIGKIARRLKVVPRVTGDGVWAR